MVNVAISFASLLGVLDIALAIFYLVISISTPIARRNTIGSTGSTLFIIQALLAPVCLLQIGGIMVFQGWRLDPILQYAFALLNVLIIYFGIKDFLLLRDR
jgi:hypothetical protein